MSVELVTLILFASLIVILATGLPLAFCMGGIAALFILICWSPQALTIIFNIAYGVMGNFLLVSIPLFIFMGLILERSGIADSAYEVMYGWLGGIRGGLAIGTVLVCTLFAACTGISGAATVTMGVIALPAMLKRKYSKYISIGPLAGGGALGILMPPSILMIVYAIISGESVGKLFAASIFPALLLASLFIIYIFVLCLFRPTLAPSVSRDERPSLKEKILSLRGLFPFLVLIFLVLGSILGGICTATEAAGFGSVGSLIFAAFYRRLKWKDLAEACTRTLNLSCMILWIIIGGSCFTALYAAIGALDFIQETVSALTASRYVILFGMQIVLLLLGMVMDPGGIIMITVPVFLPVIKVLGFDPVWFGVLFIINMEMGFLTPPFGFNLFYMKSIVPKNISMGDIIRSVMPFVALQGLCLTIIVIFPNIAMWIPNVFMR